MSFAWLFKIRTRLLLVNVLIVAVPLLGIAFARFYEREMLQALEQDMINQGEILRGMLLSDATGLRLAERQPVLSHAAKRTRTRIRLLGAKGELLADSHEAGPPEGPESRPPTIVPRSVSEMRDTAEIAVRPPRLDVSTREEVRAAMKGSYGSATRFWQDRDTLYLFSALPIVRQGKVEGVIYITRSTNTVRGAMYRLRGTLLLTLLGALAVTFVLSTFLAGTISRPLSHLTRLAQRIARGDRTQRLALERRDEIGQLARAFDRMERRLDERARYVAELTADISHEFKSPLAGIRGAAELLAEGAADDPEARQRFLSNILADAHRLDRLVSRLLELSRAEADDAPAELFDYEALVQEVADRAVARSPEVEVDVLYRASRTQLLGRRALLDSALQNLVENAQQHAAQGTHVEVYVASTDDGSIRTSVKNHGPAISEANRSKVWARFFTTRGDSGGTGLGLPIVKTIIQAHGGTLELTSSDADGTVFSFVLS
ncbi:MAG TPA: ATP-binding protein [Polyangiaceae bacterium]|nr:ATP-binding protein [Polyangiaceae bacterium]